MVSILTFSSAGASAQADGVFYKSDSESVLSLYATVDIGIANEFLRPIGLEAVDIGGGKALTGIVVACFDQIEFPAIAHSESNYCYSSLPLLVSKPGTEIQGAYLFSRSKINSASAVAQNLTMGIRSSLAEVSFLRDSESFPTGSQNATVKILQCASGESCDTQNFDTRLAMGTSKPEEFSAPVTSAINWQVADLTPMGNPANKFEVHGNIYGRPFDPKRDSYFTAPGTPESVILRHPSFTPTAWQLGQNLKVVASDLKIVK